MMINLFLFIYQIKQKYQFRYFSYKTDV